MSRKLPDKSIKSIDPKLRGRAFASKADMNAVAKICREHKQISDKTRSLLARLASYPPTVRLAVNLKITIGIMAKGPIRDVLTEGLLPEEHAALVELDALAIPPRDREIVHGLFNVHERWLLIRQTRPMFEEAQRAKNEYLQPREE